MSHWWQSRPEDAGLCGPPDISMMEATDFGNLHDRADLGRLDGPAVRRILLKREVGWSAVIVREVTGPDAAQMVFAKDEDVIQTLAPDRADQPLPRTDSATGSAAPSAPH